MDVQPQSSQTPISLELVDIKETLLHEAVKSKNIDNVCKAMVTGGDAFMNNLDGKNRSPIHVAIEEHLESIVRLFLSFEEKINDDQYLLQYAIEKGNFKIVKLLAEHFSIEAKDKKSVTAFCAAVRERKFEVLDYFLSMCSSVDTRSSNYSDCAVFHLAVIAGNTEIVEKFLESNFPINSCLTANDKGWWSLNYHAGFSPLHLAVKYLRLNVVELLLGKGADVTIKNESKSTALHLAFEAKVRGIWKSWQEFETNDKIIDALVDVQHRDSIKLTNLSGISHLHIACSRDRPEIIETLLQDKSISVNDFAIGDDQGFMSESGISHLHIACSPDRPEIIETLVQDKTISASDFVITDDRGFTSLHYAAKYRCHKVAKILLQYYGNVNRTDDELRTPLHIASRELSLEFVQLLMQHGADLTLKDSHGNTPVHLAFNDRNDKVLDLLLTGNTITNSNPVDDVGISHFHIACTRRNDINLVRGFIDAGVSVDLQVPMSDFKISYSSYNEDLDWRGCVPLHFAAAFNRAKVVELLLTHGADVHIKDAKGFSPIHVACQQTYDRFRDFISKTLSSWTNEHTVQALYWPPVLNQNRPYSDVTSVEEEMIKTDSYPRRFPNISSQIEVSRTREMFLICWELHKQEQVEIIKMLFEHGADFNVLDTFGNSPLFYIYDFNIHKILDVLDEKLHLDRNPGALIVKHLLVELYARRSCLLTVIFNFGIFINIDKSYNNGSILHYVCQKNEFYDTEKVKMLRYFLKRNADPDAFNDSNETPLHITTKNPDGYVRFQSETGSYDGLLYRTRESLDIEEMALTLLKNGAGVNVRNDEGRTPLFDACLSRKCFLTNILLHYDADVNIEDRHGKSVVYYFFRDHVKLSPGVNKVTLGIIKVAKTLVQHVQALQELGLRVNENFERPISEMIRLLKGIRDKPYDDEDFRAKLKKQVEHLKSTKIDNQICMYDVLLMDEYNVSRDVIIEQLEKILHPSNSESYIDAVLCYFPFINNKYRVAVERKRVLLDAKLTLNRLLQTNFPEVCSDLIFMPLKNIEIAYFVKAFAVYSN